MLALQCYVTTGFQRTQTSTKQTLCQEATEDDTLKEIDSGIGSLMGLEDLQLFSDSMPMTSLNCKETNNLLSRGLESQYGISKGLFLINNALTSVFEWHHRFHKLPNSYKVLPEEISKSVSEASSRAQSGVLMQKQSSEVNNSVKSGKVNLQLSKGFLANFVDSDQDENSLDEQENFPKNITVDIIEKGANLKENEVKVETKETSNSQTFKKKMTNEEKNTLKFLTKSMEFTSSYYNPEECELIDNEAMSEVFPTILSYNGCNNISQGMVF